MKKAIGYYNELQYMVTIDGEEIYTAGNSPLDSQIYVGAEDGVGLDRMKEYCIQTTKTLAEENNAEFIGCWRADSVVIKDDTGEITRILGEKQNKE